MILYRISDATVHNLADAISAAILAHPTKAADHRPYVIDVQPTPNASQKVVSAGIVVSANEARQTWQLVNKSVAELERSELETEKAQQVDLSIDALNTQIAITNAQFNALTAAQKLDVLRDDRVVLLRSVRFLMRLVRREMI